MPQNPQNKISQTALKYYNEFRGVRTEALRWLKITTDTGTKLKVETTAKEIFQQLLNFITIDVLKIEHQHLSIQYIMNISMTPIVNSHFNKNTVSWEIIHYRLLQPYYSVMKIMCRHKTLNGLPKHFHNKLNKSPCAICYTAKLTSFNKGTTVGTNNLQPLELMHMQFAIYNVTSICGFTSVITVFYTNNRMI